MNKHQKKESAQRETVNLDDFQTIDDTPTSQNYQNHYEAILLFCAAIRIFASQSITRRESGRSQELLSSACTLWADMHCHMTPNFHTSMHFQLFILFLSPAYAWWEWAYEHHLGHVSCFSTNGHSGGEMEATMMRKWLKMSLCQDLVCLYIDVWMHDSSVSRFLQCKVFQIVRQKMTKLSEFFYKASRARVKDNDSEGLSLPIWQL